MSKKVKEKVWYLPNPLTTEGLARFNKEHLLPCSEPWQKSVIAVFEKAHDARDIVLVSREMEITLASHIYIDKNYNLGLDKFFIENYPDTFKNAMKLAFRYYLDYSKKSEQEHPHFSELLELIAKREEWQEFHRCCMKLIEGYNRFERQVRETWEKIKDEVNFEKAIMAVNILYVREFLSGFNKMHEVGFKNKESFLNAASLYLAKTNKYLKKSIDHNLWEDESRLTREMDNSFTDLLKDRELLDKIYTHIIMIMNLQGFRYGICDSFIFDETFNRKSFTYNEQDDKMCDLKNFVLREYYKAIGLDYMVSYVKNSEEKYPDLSNSSHWVHAESYCVIRPLLMHYFGIEEQFTYNKKVYNLLKLIDDKQLFSSFYRDYHLLEWRKFFSNYPPGMSFEEILLKFVMLKSYIERKHRFLIDIRRFSELPRESNADCFRLFSTDIGQETGEPQIDLKLYNTFHYAQSDLCVVFPYIRATNEAGYISLLNFLRKSNKDNKKEAQRIENTVAQQFKDCPIFFGIEPIVDKKFEFQGEDGEIDVAIYKDKTLILIEVKSTYMIILFKERFQHEKNLIYAGHQLNKAIKALKTKPELLAEVAGDSNVKFDELRIETLIVSTSFEFDNQRFSGHRKISLLELMVCLHNDAIHLIITSPVLQSPEVRELCKKYESNPNKYDLNEIRFRLEHLGTNFDSSELWEDFSLYDNIKNPTMEDFLKALNSNIWEKVLPYWQEKL